MANSQASKPRARSASGPWPSSPFQAFLAFLGLFGLTLVVYWPALRGPFIWDDDAMLSASVRSFKGLAALWGGNQVDYLPMTSTVFWMGWQVWGDAPWGYRLVNVALHAASAMLLFQILRKLRLPGAGLAACLFCVHPLAVGTVAWVAELKNTLSLCFALLTVWWFLQSRWREVSLPSPALKGQERPAILREASMGYYGLACLSFLLALLSKISVVMLPFVLVALEYFRPPAAESEAKASAGRRAALALLRVAPFFALSLLLGLVNVWFQRHRAMLGFTTAADQEPLLPRLLGGGHALWFYLWKALVPVHVMPVYPRWNIQPASWLAWMPGVLWLALVGLCGWLARGPAAAAARPARHLGRISFWGLCFFTVMLLPVLGVLRISYFFISRVGDHLVYLPLVGLMAVAGFLLAGPSTGGGLSRRRLLVAVPLLVLLGLGSWHRAQLYAHPEALWRDNVAQNPQAAMAWGNLARVTADPQEALSADQESLKLEPNNWIVRQGYADLLTTVGRNEEAIAEYRTLLVQQPKNPQLHCNLGAALFRIGLVQEARAEFQAALDLAPGFALARKNLGAVFYRVGDYGAAIEQFEQALRADPNVPGAQQLLLDAQRRRAAAPTATP